MTSLDKITNGLGIDPREIIKAAITGKAIGSSMDVNLSVDKSVVDEDNLEE
jgi:hypothetical protein